MDGQVAPLYRHVEIFQSLQLLLSPPFLFNWLLFKGGSNVLHPPVCVCVSVAVSYIYAPFLGTIQVYGSSYNTTQTNCYQRSSITKGGRSRTMPILYTHRGGSEDEEKKNNKKRKREEQKRVQEVKY